MNATMVNATMMPGREQKLRFLKCICMRKNKWVYCNMCGFSMEGRIAQKCLKHPRTLFLNDLKACPRCQVQNCMVESV